MSIASVRQGNKNPRGAFPTPRSMHAYTLRNATSPGQRRRPRPACPRPTPPVHSWPHLKGVQNRQMHGNRTKNEHTSRSCVQTWGLLTPLTVNRVQETSIRPRILKRRQRDGTLFGCVFSLYIRQVNPLKKFPRALAQQKTL